MKKAHYGSSGRTAHPEEKKKNNILDNEPAKENE